MERQNGSKNQRILKLYASLMDGSVVSKAQEAAIYEVSEKSIQRDLDDIKEFIADQGLLNGEENTVVYDRRERGYRLERAVGDEIHRRGDSGGEQNSAGQPGAHKAGNDGDSGQAHRQLRFTGQAENGGSADRE